MVRLCPRVCRMEPPNKVALRIVVLPELVPSAPIVYEPPYIVTSRNVSCAPEPEFEAPPF